MAHDIVNGLYEKATSQEIDNLIAETVASRTAEHYDYGMLAGRLVVSNLHSETKDMFSGG